MRSNLFELNLRDLANGLLMAVLGGVITYVHQAIVNGGISSVDAGQVITIAVTAGLGYLVKNLFEDEKGDNKIAGLFKDK